MCSILLTWHIQFHNDLKDQVQIQNSWTQSSVLAYDFKPGPLLFLFLSHPLPKRTLFIYMLTSWPTCLSSIHHSLSSSKQLESGFRTVWTGNCMVLGIWIQMGFLYEIGIAWGPQEQGPPKPCYSKCGPQTSSMGITRNLWENADFRPCSWSPESEPAFY